MEKKETIVVETEKEKDIFFEVISVFRYLLSKWIFLLLAGIIGCVIGYKTVKKARPTYTGKLTFVLSTDSKNRGISGIAAQFGIDMGSTGDDVFAGDNIFTLFKSKKMFKLVLFKKPPGANDILANIIARDWNWDKVWKSQERTKNQFPFPSDPNALTPIQDSLFRELHGVITRANLTVERADKKSNVFQVITKSTNEVFSCYLTRFLMDETAKFYIDTKTSTAKLNLTMIQKEADSIKGALGGAISSTAAETERTFALNPALQSQRAPAQKSQARATVLTMAYGEVVRNLELAKIAVRKETPLYQIIDVPELPLKVEKVSTIKYVMIYGGVYFLLTAVFLLLIRKQLIKSTVVRHIKKEETKIEYKPLTV